MLVADEPTSALDVSVQAAVLNLIGRLQADLGFACLFVTHDLAAVEFLAQRVAVMYLGVLVEVADRASPVRRTAPSRTRRPCCRRRRYPTRVLQRQRRRVVLTGEIPSPVNPPSGLPVPPAVPGRGAGVRPGGAAAAGGRSGGRAGRLSPGQATTAPARDWPRDGSPA